MSEHNSLAEGLECGLEGRIGSGAHATHVKIVKIDSIWEHEIAKVS